MALLEQLLNCCLCNEQNEGCGCYVDLNTPGAQLHKEQSRV